MDEEKVFSAISDGNVEKLDRVNRALRGMLPSEQGMQRQRQQPGSRPDGGMAAQVRESIIKELTNQVLQHEAILQNELVDARRLIDEYEKERFRMESQISELEARLSEERTRCARFEGRCEELKNVLRSAAEIMVNAGKTGE